MIATQCVKWESSRRFENMEGIRGFTDAHGGTLQVGSAVRCHTAGCVSTRGLSYPIAMWSPVGRRWHPRLRE